jgi:hypothetical protein
MNDILEMQSRKMSGQMAAAIRRKHCRRQRSILWIKVRIVTPELLPIVYGDGKQIIALRPIITRREHVVLAVDSSIDLEHGLNDYIDQIYQDHSEFFGQCCCAECVGDDDLSTDDLFKQFPMMCFSHGSEWWQLEMRR